MHFDITPGMRGMTGHGSWERGLTAPWHAHGSRLSPDWSKTNIAGKRAEGGPVQAGKSYLVGEKGPEIVSFPKNGFVTPSNFNDELLGLVPGKGLTGLGSLGRAIKESGGYQRPGQRYLEWLRQERKDFSDRARNEELTARSSEWLRMDPSHIRDIGLRRSPTRSHGSTIHHHHGGHDIDIHVNGSGDPRHVADEVLDRLTHSLRYRNHDVSMVGYTA